MDPDLFGARLPETIAVMATLPIAALLGTIVGLEREIHGHPAGVRTHALVALGSAVFTVLSARAFAGEGTDPTRIAAQVVAGVGFLGAGAILRSGTHIRGLTTAASLWATAAVGMAAGAADFPLAVGAVIVLLGSLWPLNWLLARLRIKRPHQVTLSLETRRISIPDLLERLELPERSVRSVRSTATGKSAQVELRLSLGVELHLRDLLTRLEAAGVRVTGVNNEGD